MYKFSTSEFFNASGGVLPHQRMNFMQHLPLQPGVDLFVLSGHYADLFDAEAVSDTDAIHFSYWLEGSVRCWVDGSSKNEIVVPQGTGNISCGGGRTLRFQQQGGFTNIMILLSREALQQLEQGGLSQLHREMGPDFGMKTGFRSTELHTTAHLLFSALNAAPENQRHPLWFQAKGFELVSLFLEGYGLQRNISMSLSERKLLLAARDRLLSDLSQALTIEQLARETGVSVLKLKRGFKQLFGVGVYGLYQRERMHEAHRQLCLNDNSVTRVALDLGYSNTSHFAAAFRKQFGSSPREIKKIRKQRFLT